MKPPVKVSFRLQPDADGYPPVSVESLWADPVSEYFKIDNIPFFTRATTIDDLVQAAPDEAGNLWFQAVVEDSGHSLIRVVIFKPECEERVITELRSLGCRVEGLKAYKLLALDLPASADLAKVQEYLRSEAEVGNIDYEEALIRS
jgi:hypothetical protein